MSFSKSKIPFSISAKKLKIFPDLQSAIDGGEIDLLILDGLAVLLEIGVIRDAVNTVLKAEAVSKNLVVRTEINAKYPDELMLKSWLAKRTDLLMETTAISFISKEVHGKGRFRKK